jgi:hypothetical protein
MRRALGLAPKPVTSTSEDVRACAVVTAKVAPTNAMMSKMTRKERMDFM